MDLLTIGIVIGAIIVGFIFGFALTHISSKSKVQDAIARTKAESELQYAALTEK